MPHGLHHPDVWAWVLLGPALVVVAALWTVYLAHQGADQVLLPRGVGPASSANKISNHATTRTDSWKGSGTLTQLACPYRWSSKNLQPT
jgi:hypothetical protein